MSDAPTPQTPTSTQPDVIEPADRDFDVTEIPAGRRTSANVELLVIEAELVAEGKDLDNPARPDSPDVVDAVMTRLDEGQRPAWAEVDDDE